MVFDFLGFCLTFSAPETLKNLSFEMPVRYFSPKLGRCYHAPTMVQAANCYGFS